MALNKSDAICFVSTCSDNDVIAAVCSEGKLTAFQADSIRLSSRTASGVAGKKVAKGVHAQAHVLFEPAPDSRRGGRANANGLVRLHAHRTHTHHALFTRCR